MIKLGCTLFCCIGPYRPLLPSMVWPGCSNDVLTFSLFKVNHYKCPLCDMTCPSPSSLRNHIKFRHSNEKPYSCDYCEYRWGCFITNDSDSLDFVTPPNLLACNVRHDLFVCVHVVFSCKNLIDLRKHLDTHSSEPAYRCDFTDCDYSTRSLYSIKNHYKRIHEVSHLESNSNIRQ